MTVYTRYNAALAVIVLLLSLGVFHRPSRWREVILAARIGVLVMIFGYPWDFFAIRLGVWRYPKDPGLTVHGVPGNDLLFMWLCTYFASSFLIWTKSWHRGSQGHAQSKHARE